MYVTPYCGGVEVWVVVGSAGAVVGAAAAVWTVVQSRAASGRTAPPLRSERAEVETVVTFVNKTPFELTLWWVNYDGQPVSFGPLDALGARKVKTYVTHPWRVGTANGPMSQPWYPTAKPSRIVLHGMANPAYDTFLGHQEDGDESSTW